MNILKDIIQGKAMYVEFSQRDCFGLLLSEKQTPDNSLKCIKPSAQIMITNDPINFQYLEDIKRYYSEIKP